MPRPAFQDQTDPTLAALPALPGPMHKHEVMGTAWGTPRTVPEKRYLPCHKKRKTSVRSRKCRNNEKFLPN